jgi:hypothetical protein
MDTWWRPQLSALPLGGESANLTCGFEIRDPVGGFADGGLYR